MSIKKTETGWIVDIQPGGRGHKRFRKTFDTKREALEWETWVKGQTQQEPEWSPKSKKDRRRLTELIELWWQHHGQQLRDGEHTRNRLRQLADMMGNPLATEVTAESFAAYRSIRLDAGVKANTVNREHAYLRAVFNELKRLGHWNGENPLSAVRQFKIVESELSFLTLEQIKTLLAELDRSQNAHVGLVTRVALATGARWSEAEGLRSSQLRENAIDFSRTKSGKNRTVPISADLASMLHAQACQHTGALFGPCYEAFRDAVARTDIELPKGQMTHVLRHTFASHFMMNGGNILALQRILGHSTLTMTMRYAHLSPDHLAEAATLNPLSRLTVG
ncbi:tyrosine-type recombinase/integrase [Vogesella sp. XCS3]|uniref:phage integrase n=1 Tax=Vogesella sp. XCS3 TaxID=2877939 RepID=UPI001D0A3793|nr:tyrosine-type recombinase/integrase [Vogesella sp. XCS3]UDM18323.1 tyrosine-type recombinase/integrase [Vogesella sp. XCS3]